MSSDERHRAPPQGKRRPSMAYSKKTGREYQSRRERGYRIPKSPKGYDRLWMPTVCGLIDADGNECLNDSVYGLCDEHYEERMRRLGQWRDRSEFFEGRSW
jgi:hypothetical protein